MNATTATAAQNLTAHTVGRSRTVHLGYKSRTEGRAYTACGQVDLNGPTAHQHLRSAYGQDVTCKRCAATLAPADEAPAAKPAKRTVWATAPSGRACKRTSKTRHYTHAVWAYAVWEGETIADSGIYSFHGSAALAAKGAEVARSRGFIAGVVEAVAE